MLSIVFFLHLFWMARKCRRSRQRVIEQLKENCSIIIFFSSLFAIKMCRKIVIIETYACAILFSSLFLSVSLSLFLYLASFWLLFTSFERAEAAAAVITTNRTYEPDAKAKKKHLFVTTSYISMLNSVMSAHTTGAVVYVYAAGAAARESATLRPTTWVQLYFDLCFFLHTTFKCIISWEVMHCYTFFVHIYYYKILVVS